jgi:dolichol kinase
MQAHKFQFRTYSGLSNSEILRKVIHISGFSVAFVHIYLFNNPLVILALFLVTVLYALSELARTKEINIPVFSTITRKAAASRLEINHFVTAPISFAMGITLSLLIFPTYIAYASIAVLTLGDGFACIFGKIFGKTPLFFNRKKNLEGTICGFTCAFLGATLFVSPLKALVAAAVGMLAECLPLPIDDNLVIPLSAGTALILFASF